MPFSWAAIASFFSSLFSNCFRRAPQRPQVEVHAKFGSAHDISIIATTTTCLTDAKS
jgi:hypothetical protein